MPGSLTLDWAVNSGGGGKRRSSCSSAELVPVSPDTATTTLHLVASASRPPVPTTGGVTKSITRRGMTGYGERQPRGGEGRGPNADVERCGGLARGQRLGRLGLRAVRAGAHTLADLVPLVTREGKAP